MHADKLARKTTEKAGQSARQPGLEPARHQLAAAEQPARALPVLFGLTAGLQPHLAVGRPGDLVEREADSTAKQVTSMEALQAQRMCQCGGQAGPDGECAACKTRRLRVDARLQSVRRSLEPNVRSYMEPRFKRRDMSAECARPVAPSEPKGLLTRPFRRVPATGRQAEEAQATELANAVLHMHAPHHLEPLAPIIYQPGLLLDDGQPVPPAIRKRIESGLGWSMAAVRIHSGTESTQAAEALGARAFALGSHVYFGANQFKNGSAADQRLLAHELVHIALYAPLGPAVPLLTPDEEQTLETMLDAHNFRAAQFFAFLRAHPDQLQDARRSLVDRLFGSSEQRQRALPLLTRLLRENPRELATVEEQLEEHSRAYRTEATNAVVSLWAHYESSAHIYALRQWTQNHLTAEQRSHRRPQVGQTPPLPTVLEAQLAAQLAACDVQLAQARTERTRLYNLANQALADLMEESAPLSYLQEGTLRDLSDRLTGSANVRRRERLRIAEARRLLDYHPTRRIEQQFADVTRERERTATALATANAHLQLTEVEEEGDTPQQQRAHRQRLAGARRNLTVAQRAADRAAAAATPEGAREPELALYMRSLDDEQRQEAQSVLDSFATRRDEQIDPLLTRPNEIQEETGYTWEPGDMLTESDRWDIQQDALRLIENGFPHFSAEANQQLILPRLSRVASDRQNVGLSAGISVGTYTGHGPGQYDISESAGRHVLANRPNDPDLTVALGPAADGSRRHFIWQSSQVRNVGTIDAHSADEDTLAKLLYGYFGRAWHEPQIETFLRGVTTGLPTRNPDPTRVIAALYFENTIELPPGAAPAFDARRVALRTGFESEVRAELAAMGIIVSGPLLEAVNASSGQFDATFAIHQSTMRAATNPRTGRLFVRNEGSAPVMAAAARVLARSTPATAAIEALIRDMRAPAAGLNGGRSGPFVQLVHHYQEVDANNQPLSTHVWVTVSYRHLRSIGAGLSPRQSVVEGADLGAVGSSGNAVSPHVHMEIAVYDRDPGSFTRQEPIAYLTPFQFFPFLLRWRSGTAAP